MCVVNRREPRSPGGFGWDGGFGTSWYSDPKAGLVGILMTQVGWMSPSPPEVLRDFWDGVYRTIEA
jgi:CubicO group peptidase (beta-lactamase class C family)